MEHWWKRLDNSRSSFDRKLSFAIKLAGVVHHAHQFSYIGADGNEVVGVLHGDIKPNNVLVDKLESPKLIDFMVVDASQVIDQDALMRVKFGTPFYTPIEQAKHGITTSKSDVFSLGRTLHSLFESGEHEKKLLSFNRSVVWKEIFQLIDRCVTTEPKFRPTAFEVQNSLQQIQTRVNSGKIKFFEDKKSGLLFENPELADLFDAVENDEQMGTFCIYCGCKQPKSSNQSQFSCSFCNRANDFVGITMEKHSCGGFAILWASYCLRCGEMLTSPDSLQIE